MLEVRCELVVIQNIARLQAEEAARLVHEEEAGAAPTLIHSHIHMYTRCLRAWLPVLMLEVRCVTLNHSTVFNNDVVTM